MNRLEMQQSIIMILLIIVFIWLFITSENKWSYGIGAFLMYVMCSLVMTKLENEYKDRINNLEVLNGRK